MKTLRPSRGHELDAARRFRAASFKQLGNRRGVATALKGLAIVASSTGDLATASRLYAEVIAIDASLSAAITGTGGACPGRSGSWASSPSESATTRRRNAMVEECLGIARRLGSRRLVAEELAFLGHIADRQGDPLRSRRMLEESLLEFEQVGDQAEVRRVLSELERLRVPE